MVDELRQITEKTLTPDQKSAQRDLARNKLLVRQRVNRLLDPGTAFLELSQLAAHKLYGKEDIKSAGIITGIGRVCGQLAMITANDSTVKGKKFEIFSSLFTFSSLFILALCVS